MLSPTRPGATHAGGIQPSASFFRPSKPAQYSNQESEDVYPLGSLKRSSASSEDHSVTATGDEHTNTLKGVKQSREPLLPIGERPSPAASRPSVARERSASSSVANPLAPARNATGRLVRNSLEVVFNLRRGISFESLRQSGSTRELTRPSTDTKALDMIPRKPASSNFDTSRPSPSPDLPFPVQHQNPPLSAVPIIDPATNIPIHNWQVHPSRNRFYLNGHVMTGGDSPWAFIACLTIMLSVAGVWLATTCVWWWHNESPAVAIVGAYLTLITLTCMFRAASSDPGVLPRDLDPDPPYPAISPSDGTGRVPMPRDLKVRSDVVRVKYCPTCKTYRPPRSSHCKMCDNCVDGCDHHCQWINNCVGRRNYTDFFVLLFTATLTLIVIICTAALHLFFLTRREDLDFKHALREGAGSAVAFSMSILLIWPVAALLSYHMRLLLLNITTIEQIRNQAHKTLVPGPPPPNPFSHGSWRKNLLAVLGRPPGYSWIRPSSLTTQDNRKINPGLATNDEVWKSEGS